MTPLLRAPATLMHNSRVYGEDITLNTEHNVAYKSSAVSMESQQQQGSKTNNNDEYDYII